LKIQESDKKSKIFQMQQLCAPLFGLIENQHCMKIPETCLTWPAKSGFKAFETEFPSKFG
jgi:hypothetical protein